MQKEVKQHLYLGPDHVQVNSSWKWIVGKFVHDPAPNWIGNGPRNILGKALDLFIFFIMRVDDQALGDVLSKVPLIVILHLYNGITISGTFECVTMTDA